MGHRTRITMVGAVASAAVLVSACGSAADPAIERRAGAYAAIVAWAADTLPPNPRKPLVFVQTRGTAGIDLDTQAAVVRRLEGRVTVRFIDERSEAVDAKAERDPVRGGGVLLVVPTLSADHPVVLSVTLYRETNAVRSYRVMLTRRDGSWAVTAAVEQPMPS